MDYKVEKSKDIRIAELKKLKEDINLLLQKIKTSEYYGDYYDSYNDAKLKIEELLAGKFDQKEIRELYDSIPRILYLNPQWHF